MTQKLLFSVLFGQLELLDPTSLKMKTISCHSHITTLQRDDNEFLAPQLPPDHNLWFQQYGAMPHMTVIRMAVLHYLFAQQVISHFGDVPCPPR